MSTPEFSKDIIIIKIGKISVEGDPNQRRVLCACGDDLIYQKGPFSTTSNGEHLEIEEVWAFRHTDSDCATLFMLPEVAKEVESKIDVIRVST